MKTPIRDFLNGLFYGGTTIAEKGKPTIERTNRGKLSDVMDKIANIFHPQQPTPQQQYQQPTQLAQPVVTPVEQYSTPPVQEVQPTTEVAMTPTARNPNFSQFEVPTEVSDAIVKAGNMYGDNKLVQLLFDVALQESSYRPSLRNPEGTATGLFQFTDQTWDTVKKYANMPGSTLKLPTDNRYDPETNAIAAAYLIAHGQLGRWDASKGVWGQYYAPEEIAPYYSQTLGYQGGE